MHPKPTPLAALAVAALAMVLAACQPATGPSTDVDSAEDPVARTWRYAGVVLPPDPADATRTPIAGLMYQGRMQEALAKLNDLERKLPVILYLHACNGLGVAFWKLAEHYAQQGYACFAPNSFSRGNRIRTCPRDAASGAWRKTHWLRHQEISFAREQIRALRWVKQSHVYMIGFSEGGMVGHTSTEPDVRARVLLGMGCRNYNQRPRPASQPTLIIKAKHDPILKGSGLCLPNRHALSEAYEIESSVHEITHDPRVLNAIDRFLAVTG